MTRITPSLVMLSLLFVGACGDQSSTISGPRPAASARFDLSSTPPTDQTFCSGGTVGGASNLAVSGTGAAAAGFVPNQAQVPWTGTGANVGSAAALWVVPFGPSAATNNKGANQDAFDNTDYTYSIGFNVPAGFTASLSGLALRDNSDTVKVDGTAITGSEIHNNNRANFGAGVSINPPLPAAPPVAQVFSTTGLAAGPHTVSFVVWNENLSALNNNVLFPNPANAARPAPNPTGIIFCFTVHPIAPPPVALFVIGDVEDHAIGDNVFFWGAQWWKNNQMSGITDNGYESFKGFAVTSDNVCGGKWTSLPGNSSNPPDEIGADIAIIVTTKVLKDGNDISGDIKQIVIVHTDPGYAGNPGHAGTGTVTKVVCP